jgi:hypothetical protein
LGALLLLAREEIRECARVGRRNEEWALWQINKKKNTLKTLHYNLFRHPAEMLFHFLHIENHHQRWEVLLFYERKREATFLLND